jgi:NAD(P)-dependent dehydrogenase (short-subunit alcohol dehydrogenase family)
MLSSLASVRTTVWRRERRRGLAFDLGRGERSRRPRSDRLAASGGSGGPGAPEPARDRRRDREAVVFLASDDAHYVTGTELFVDSGLA